MSTQERIDRMQDDIFAMYEKFKELSADHPRKYQLRRLITQSEVKIRRLRLQHRS